MKITNTKNSTLGRALSFDPSYIGRIRTGKRGLPKNQPFIEPTAAFFARRIREDYQKKTAAEAICAGRIWPEERADAQRLIASWLSEDGKQSADSVGTLLAGISATAMPSMPEFSCGAGAAEAQTAEFYYGNSGKREAVLAFLTELCALGTPQTLLLYSDEDMLWLYENKAFVRQWAMLLVKLTMQGGHIKIVHTVSRNIGDMLEAIQRWVPLYMSGAIEPYYYPKLRDGVCRRTLFVAKGHAAVVSNSIGEHTQDTLNLFIHDRAAVRALETEFLDYFALCRPLMQIFNLRNSDALWDTLSAFENSGGDMILAHTVPSHFTMPEEVAKSMALRSGSKFITTHQRQSQQRFARLLSAGNTVTEILRLPNPDVVRAGGLAVAMCDLFGQPGLCYSAEEYRLHLQALLRLQAQEPNYRLVITDRMQVNILVCAKEDVGVFVTRAALPTIVFGMSEQRITAAFWTHLQQLAGTAKNDKAAKQVEAFLRRLEEQA